MNKIGGIFSFNLKRLRNSKGLTQSELAENVELGLRTIQNYEQDGRLPNTDIIDKLISYFDIEPFELFQLSDSSIGRKSLNLVESLDEVGRNIEYIKSSIERDRLELDNVPTDIIEKLSLVENFAAIESALNATLKAEGKLTKEKKDVS